MSTVSYCMCVCMYCIVLCTIHVLYCMYVCWEGYATFLNGMFLYSFSSALSYRNSFLAMYVSKLNVFPSRIILGEKWETFGRTVNVYCGRKGRSAGVREVRLLRCVVGERTLEIHIWRRIASRIESVFFSYPLLFHFSSHKLFISRLIINFYQVEIVFSSFKYLVSWDVWNIIFI